jgi:hypothetical protein
MTNPFQPRRNAEREFLDSIRGAAAALSPIAQARQVQHHIDDARGFRLPVGEVHELEFEQLTRPERDALFGSFFADTVPAPLS